MADVFPPEALDELARLRAARDRQLAALGEVYHPRLRALHDELDEKRRTAWAEYDAAVARLASGRVGAVG